MKDLVEFRFTVATKELNGKAIAPIAKVISKGLKKTEPQVMRLVEAITKSIEDYLDVEPTKVEGI